MNAVTETKAKGKVETLEGLDLLRAPFPENQISKLPKPTKRQTEDVRNDFKKGIRCNICGGWHHPKVVHLDYVGHAALTDRLLDCDQTWNWEPVAFSEKGTPLLDDNGGMWIRLTVCGQTRLGYGHPDGKRGGDAVKEVIGDALRNAAMRFGAALDLWHKGDLHVPEEDETPKEGEDSDNSEHSPPKADPERFTPEQIRDNMKSELANQSTLDGLAAVWSEPAFQHALGSVPDPMRAEIEAVKNRLKADLAKDQHEPIDDEIPY